MDFSVSLAEIQMKEGRGFILEQPAPATSWQRPKVRKLVENLDVYLVRADMCQFGLRAQCGPHQGELGRKPTILATNIGDCCSCSQSLPEKSSPWSVDWWCKHAAVSTPAFVKAIVSGIKALGIKAYFQHSDHLKQAFMFEKNLGYHAQVFARDCLEVDAELAEAYGLHLDLGLCGQEGQASNQPLDFCSTMNFEMLRG